MIRVAFDAQSLYGGKSGLGVYVTSLVHALKNSPELSGVEIDFYPESESRFRGFLNTPRRLQWEIFGFPGCVGKKQYDIAHIPAFATGWPSAKTVLTVHDLIGMAFPNQAGIAGRFYWGQWLAWAARRADHLIADSEHTRNDLLRLLRIPENKITLISPSGHEDFQADLDHEQVNQVKNRFGIKNSYFMFVGTFEPRKNLPRVMEAFKILLESHPHHQLVLIGSGEFAHGTYMKSLMNGLTLEAGRVLTPGFIDHKSLNALYCGADALVFPSLYEGFGIPILEAMAAGCPVITANITSTPEVAGDAAILVNPHSVPEIAAAMKSIAESAPLRQKLRQKGFERIKNFSWAATAGQTLRLYKRLTQ